MLIVPGLRGYVADHWQTLLAEGLKGGDSAALGALTAELPGQGRGHRTDAGAHRRPGDPGGSQRRGADGGSLGGATGRSPVSPFHPWRPAGNATGSGRQLAIPLSRVPTPCRPGAGTRYRA